MADEDEGEEADDEEEEEEAEHDGEEEAIPPRMLSRARSSSPALRAPEASLRGRLPGLRLQEDSAAFQRTLHVCCEPMRRELT